MLPFLKNKEAGASSQIDSIERKPDEPKEYDALEGAMEELHSALISKNYKDAAEIFRSCCDLSKGDSDV
jgi:hypothetical protein